MPRIFAPLLSGATYARWLHLAIGWIFAAVVLMVYPGTYGFSLGGVVLRAVPADAALLVLVAMLPAMRRAEGVQARLLLMPEREEDIATEPARTWADRRRTAVWLVGRTALGTAVGILSVLVPAAAFDLLFRPEPRLPGGLELPAGEGTSWYPLAAPVLLFALGWLVVWAGRLQLAMAVRLLGPSPAERLAAAELRAERLLERNLLARELHDSIGHALTVTVIQAGAAREVGDAAFVAKALEVIEETGRKAMEDLERTLVLLRDTGEPGAARAPGTTPGAGDARERPGIEQLPGLFDTARSAGSPVEAWIDVPSGRLPGVLSREGYRIVQEGVTNALKYAPGEPISVRVTLRDDRLELRCANALGSSAASVRVTPRRGGKGLRGIRERAVLLGGEASAGAESGEWVLAVRVPLRLGA
ncbi:sensor histidine kinase [Kitasatospora sp. NPDC056181]|uniref:sensor histidine kinase n=1 Tax=Kitasatospora sp. NPDC056181 TaxID=3345737 RepID=UPI0035D870F2